MAVYRTGDVVEVMFPEPGFLGSFFLATVIDLQGDAELYVEFHQLLTPDEQHFLREFIAVVDVRPLPPFRACIEFGLYDLVDVYINDGWWCGRVIGVSAEDGHYEVFFDFYDEASYNPYYELRPHLEWVSDRWVG